MTTTESAGAPEGIAQDIEAAAPSTRHSGR